MVWMEVSNGKEIFYKLHKVVTKLHKQQTLKKKVFSHKYFFPFAVQELLLNIAY